MPQHLAAAYDCLRAFPPFTRFHLPPSEGVIFRVTRHNDRQAHYTRDSKAQKNHEIVISELYVGQFNTLMHTMAHEMIHFYQDFAKTATTASKHNAEFRSIARQVCRQFDWDYKQFI